MECIFNCDFSKMVESMGVTDDYLRHIKYTIYVGWSCQLHKT